MIKKKVKGTVKKCPFNDFINCIGVECMAYYELRRYNPEDLGENGQPLKGKKHTEITQHCKRMMCA
jgi:hypothetical protein